MSDQVKLTELEEKLLDKTIVLLKSTDNIEQLCETLEIAIQVYAVIASSKSRQESAVHFTSTIQPLTDEQIDQIGARLVSLARRNGVKL